MKRGRIRQVEKCRIHLTHPPSSRTRDFGGTRRCQERRFLLQFQNDRRNFVKRLKEGTEKYGADVLDFVVTSNHVHLLLWANSGSIISEVMQYIQGTTGRDFNRRKNREGAFWSGRYHPTLIQNGAHLTRCLFYIALNMVRAKVVVHPSEWECCGYHEIAGENNKHSVVNLNRLL